jgi:hypothetical protein
MSATPKLYRGPDDPLVIELLSPVHRSSENIFFIIEGEQHKRINVADRLRTLGIGWINIAAITKSYPFQMLPFLSEHMKAVAAEKAKRQSNKPIPEIKDEDEDIPIKPTYKNGKADTNLYSNVSTTAVLMISTRQ